MNRILFLGAAAVLLAGCGQLELPGTRTAAVGEPAPVASQPAQPVIYEIHNEAPAPAPSVVNTNTTYVEPQAAAGNVVVVRERTRYRTRHRPGRPFIGMVIRPVLRHIFRPRHFRPPERRRNPDPHRGRQRPPSRRPGPPRERERPGGGRGGRGRG